MKKPDLRFSFSPKRYFAVFRKEVNHIFRDPMTLALIFMMPIFMIILFGFAVSGEIRNIPMAVWDLNKTQAEHEHFNRDNNFSDALINEFDNSPIFNVLYMINSEEEMMELTLMFNDGELYGIANQIILQMLYLLNHF